MQTFAIIIGKRLNRKQKNNPGLDLFQVHFRLNYLCASIAHNPIRQTCTFYNIGSIFVSWYDKKLSSWYLAKLRYQVDVYWYLFDEYIYLTLFWCLWVKKLMSKSHQTDDYNISAWKVLSGQIDRNEWLMQQVLIP
jgi:hypothetical protein